MADAAEQNGVLYTKENWEKAVAQIFSEGREKPSFLGVTPSDEKLAINICPVVMFLLTIMLWHSVRRIDFSRKPCDEPWILVDIRGPVEGGLAACWLAFMLASVVAVMWAVLAYNIAELPIGYLQVFWSEEYSYTETIPWRQIMWKVVIGGLFVVVGVFFLLSTIHLVLKGESDVYRDVVSGMRFRRRRSSA